MRVKIFINNNRHLGSEAGPVRMILATLYRKLRRAISYFASIYPPSGHARLRFHHTPCYRLRYHQQQRSPIETNQHLSLVLEEILN